MLMGCRAKKRARQLPKNSLATVKNKFPLLPPSLLNSAIASDPFILQDSDHLLFKAKDRFVFLSKNNGSFQKAPCKRLSDNYW